MVAYDYSKLLGRMKEQHFTQKGLADALGISETSLNLTLNNNRNFKQTEMLKACEALDIPLDTIPEYFFAR